MRVDMISQICVFCDYPHFRRHISKYRDQYEKIIFYPSRHHGFIDLEAFLKEQVKETWVDPVPIAYGIEDWRQAETTPCLAHSTAEWICFREQDFFVDNWEKFYDDVHRLMGECDLFGWSQNESRPYIHPCCMYIKRELLERTSKDFSAHPEILDSDHFATLTQDAIKLGAKIIKLQDIGWKNWENAFHMQGLTYPYQNWSTDRIFGVTNKEAFFVYNYFSQKVPVVQNERYSDLSWEIHDYMKRHEKRLGMLHTVPESSSFWKFFL